MTTDRGQSIEVLPDGTKTYVQQMNGFEYRSYFMSNLYGAPANPATIDTVAATWGSQTVPLQTASDGLRLLPAGRVTDLPWFGIQKLSITLNQAVSLVPTDVTVTGLTGGNYGPVTISGSGTTFTITLNKPINNADRVTITIANPTIVSFTRRLDVLPGDVNDDGVVNTTDGLLILSHETPAHAYQAIYDMNGDGVVNTADFNLYRPKIGSKLPAVASSPASASSPGALVMVIGLSAIDDEDFAGPLALTNGSATIIDPQGTRDSLN